MRGAFTCVGWQVTLCDPIWQVTSLSSKMGFLRKNYIGLDLYLFSVFVLTAILTLHPVVVYALGHKKVPHFYDNFGKRGPISIIILSLLDS